MDVTGGFFQIRPHKEFIPSKGRERLLSLPLLSDLPQDGVQSVPTSEISHNSGNAYNFMKTRRELNGDPTMKRWNALIRLSNFASAESSPLCVSAPFSTFSISSGISQLASIGALLDHLVREHAVGDLDDAGINGLEVGAIEIISL